MSPEDVAGTDHHGHPGPPGPAAMVALPLADRHRAGHRVDPRRPGGDHRRVDVGAAQREGHGISLLGPTSGSPAAIYVAGACIGALFFGQLTDRSAARSCSWSPGHLHRRHGATAFSINPIGTLRLSLHHRCRDRRRVRGDQLGDRRADPLRYRGRVDLDHQRVVLGGCRPRLGDACAADHGMRSTRVGWRRRLRTRRGPRSRRCSWCGATCPRAPAGC